MSESRGGRPPGRELTELELQHIQLLQELRERAASRRRDWDTRLEDFVLALLEDGASANGIGAVLGVSSGTVQRWKDHAHQRRGGA